MAADSPSCAIEKKMSEKKVSKFKMMIACINHFPINIENTGKSQDINKMPFNKS